MPRAKKMQSIAEQGRIVADALEALRELLGE
jgi:hypothetical protein